MTEPDITTSWAHIHTWLSTHAPATLAAIRPPATQDVLDHVETHLGEPDLIAWWSAHDGTAAPAGQVLPGYTPFGLAESARSRTLWLEIAQDVWDDWAREAGAANPAGEPAWAFLPQFVPIATNGSGDDLIVDLRPGINRGCLKEYHHEQGALGRPVAPSLKALIAEVALALPARTPVLGHVASARDGLLYWFPG
jgi:cell wall assembly regulator SMI1